MSSLPPRSVIRQGWTRLSTVSSKTSQHWRHDASGWEVRHCGHPTANHPYYATDPEHPDRAVVSHNGRGFDSLDVAMLAVNMVLAGQLEITNDRCAPRTRRIIITCAGTPVLEFVAT